MQALIEIKEGERPYKGGSSQWLRDQDGALVFKVISKQRQNGNIEFICYTQRSDAVKRIIQHISFSEGDFWNVVNVLENSLREFFPDIIFSIQNIDLRNPDRGYRVMKNNKLNLLKLWIFNWFGSKFNAVKTYVERRK